jgi:carboxypeptidase PM20D1
MYRPLFKRGLLLLGALFLVLVGALLVNALMFTSRQLEVEPEAPYPLDEAKLAARLAGAVRFKTVSYQDPARRDPEELRGLHRYLAESFPKAHGALKRELVGGLSLLYTWQGSEPALAPIVLAAHMDVVPVEEGTEASWKQPPFGGVVDGGFIWGRGTMDDKVAVVGILEAVESLLAEGYAPRRTVYLAFGHDEEASGREGAMQIAALLEERGVKPEFVLDEGLIGTKGVFPGLSTPLALIGISEKGYVSVSLTARAEGGHSSMPPPHTAAGRVAAAVAKLEARPMPGRLDGPTGALFDYVGPEMGFLKRLVFANRWLFGPVILSQLAAAPSSNAMIRTTTAATILKGSDKDNVLPQEAHAVVNFRIYPGDSIERVLAFVRDTVDDPEIEVAPEVDSSSEPSPISSAESPAFLRLAGALRAVFPEAIVAPSLVIGATDGRYYTGITPDVYRLLPIWADAADLKRIHGTDERVSLSDYAGAVRFYRRLIKDSDR